MNKVHSVLRSSRAAIDLASIMVGVIIIGLIGGVIAATVFVVIPWAQDNAAKQQIESIHTAENALYGLSSDTQVELQGGAAASSFGDSSILQANSLLQKNANYCVRQTENGKNYIAYSKSGSGKVFTASNSNKTANVYTKSAFPCTSGDYDDSIGTVVTNVSTYDFENWNSSIKVGSPWYYSNAAYNEVRVETATVHGGKTSAAAYAATQGTTVGIGFNQTVEKGATYRISGWIKTDNNGKTFYIQSGTDKSTEVTASTAWTKVSITTVATSTNLGTTFFVTNNGQYAMPWIYLDDVSIDKVEQ